MTDEIRIWAIDGSSKVVEQVQPTEWKETEGSLEDALVKNPDMLMRGLKLVGRQMPTDNGVLDLLGVDENGTLVVFELKRKKPTREAVAQAIDYCSYLESLSEEKLAEMIAEHSGKNGIDTINNFDAWYREQYEGKELTELKPTRVALVGLGVDAVAQRMVEFLAKNGVDISLVTFQGYQCKSGTLLARQVEGGEAREAGSSQRQKRHAEWRREHAKRAAELGITDLWQDALNALDLSYKDSATKLGITFYQRKITLPDDVRVSGSYSVVIDDQRPMIRVNFYPGSVDLCWDIFQEKKDKLPFEFEESRNAPKTKRVSEQWYCLLDAEKWETHKGALIALAKAVTGAWEKKRNKRSA